ncbi:protein disulfide oxidoreductase [Vibrio parahaemolyticus]|uniref:protein disulfide oxidoreductase n=1 Tax=Vibrio parahaemolyticus TaxID=670 RepID=UPI0005423404|nr:protein disulfide oxidoreductase [Vibrio parahaemolyticus]KHF13173.1 redoxin [Vibrio parahaemolyticus]MDF4745271.1 protein disulfide oxidoreductase [Vibrio parahaemolyticus]MDS1791875.1 protein disulfide oxidoreductase [Vibrio parahaemolyticus]OTV95970.1 redoxin [Vibrio parahaemolyticus]OTW00133.1 redoxin [Vibrio parahaemolyticus]
MNTVKKRKSLKYWLGQVLQMVLIVTVISLAMDWYRAQDMPSEQAPSLSAIMGDGEYVDVVAKSHEEPVVVYFWATWCPVCKFVSPSVSWLSQHYSVVGVSGASGPQERVTQFMQAKDYRFDNINDPKGEVMQEWEISVTPTIYILRDGEVSSVTTGVTTPIGILARIWLAR